MCGFQLVVPLRRGVGVVDEHQGRLVAQSHGLPLHRLPILCHENVGGEGIQGLKQALNDPNPVVNIPAVMTLGEIGSPVFDLLVETLNTTDNIVVQMSIINALGSMGDERGVEVLKHLSQNKSADPYLQESATSALSRLEMVMKYKS